MGAGSACAGRLRRTRTGTTFGKLSEGHASFTTAVVKPTARSHLRHDLARHQLEVVEVVEVEGLEVHPLRAELGVLTDPVDQLGRRPGEPGGAQVVEVPTDGVGAAAYVGIGGAAAQHQRVGVAEVVGV